MQAQDKQELPATVTKPLYLATLAVVLVIGAIAFWAGFAPLATTIRASGSLVSATPSYELQHAFGGRISRVAVVPQQDVAAGDVLFELDMDVQHQSLGHLQRQITLLQAENDVIRVSLGEQDGPVDAPADLVAQYDEMRMQLELDVKASRASAVSSRARAATVETGIDILHQRIERIGARAESMAALVKKGVLAEAQTEGQADLLLTVRSQINEQQSELALLQDQADQAALAIENLYAKYRLTLLGQLKNNESRLPQLQRQALALQAEIDAGVVRSPIDGKVVSLQFDTDRMYAPRGTTLATLSQPLQDPSVKFNIPTQAIDQVHQGMVGTLTIPSLPQRNLPKIRIELVSVSPDAAKDQDGNSIGYPAKARILPEDLAKAAEALPGGFHLATDMPVSVALEGRKVTFAKYLFAPFFAMFKGAIQD